jgi:hypothetical protein
VAAKTIISSANSFWTCLKAIMRLLKRGVENAKGYAQETV